MGIERKYFFIETIARDYPELEDWFADPENISAQFQGNKRLLSAREKIHLFGGERQIKNNLEHLPKPLQSLYLTLLSSRIDPMVLTEIALFNEMLGINPHKHFFSRLDNTQAMAREAFYSTKRPLRTGELTTVSDLTYILRLTNAPDVVIVSKNREGYLTTDKGLSTNAEQLQKIRAGRFPLKKLIPNLN